MDKSFAVCVNGHEVEGEFHLDDFCQTCGAKIKRLVWRPVSKYQAPAQKLILDQYDDQMGCYVYDKAEEKRLMRERGLRDMSGDRDMDKGYAKWARGERTAYSFPKGVR